MTELEAALAALTGIGTTSVEDEFKAAGLLDEYGRPLTSSSPPPTRMRSMGDKAKEVGGSLKNAGNVVKDALGTAVGFADELVTPAARQAQFSAYNRLGGIGMGNGPMNHIVRFAASPKALMLAKVGTGIGALGGVLGAADVLAGNDSFANKAMDTVAMGIGGTLGAVGGPVGIAAGAGLGKMASDATQFVLGGGKSADQRRMEEALAALRGGQI